MEDIEPDDIWISSMSSVLSVMSFRGSGSGPDLISCMSSLGTSSCNSFSSVQDSSATSVDLREGFPFQSVTVLSNEGSVHLILSNILPVGDHLRQELGVLGLGEASLSLDPTFLGQTTIRLKGPISRLRMVPRLWGEVVKQGLLDSPRGRTEFEVTWFLTSHFLSPTLGKAVKVRVSETQDPKGCGYYCSPLLFHPQDIRNNLLSFYCSGVVQNGVRVAQ
ncbi:hypothetical protein Tco_1447951 [Tanacetum coccineum]